jgi:hypothetical protein
MTDHLKCCSTQVGDECDCPAANGPDSLECDHCGGPAYESPNGLFGDGDGTTCMTCGHPGCVVVDDSDWENPSAQWSSSDADDARCNEADCVVCND